MDTQPMVKANSAETNQDIEILAGILVGYGQKTAGKLLLGLDDSQSSCGLAERQTILSEFSKMLVNTRDTPCNTEPSDAYFERQFFYYQSTCESEWGKGSCEACGMFVGLYEYPKCRNVKKLWMNGWNSFCETCLPNCPAPLSHPMGTWNYVKETDLLPIGQNIVTNLKDYYTKCVTPPKSDDHEMIMQAVQWLATKAAGAMCPECLLLYDVAMEVKPMVTIFDQMGMIDTYIQTEDFYHQGYALGKIAKESINLIENTKNVVLLSLDKDTEMQAERKQLGSSFFGDSAQIDDTVMVDQDQTVAGRKAFELFLEGLNNQFAPEKYDFDDCLAKFYTNELELLDQHLQSIRRDLDSETGDNLIEDLKGINNLYLQADAQCSDIMVADRVEQMNRILDEFTLEFKPMNRSEGVMQPEVRLVSAGASLDISDQIYSLSAQAQLIERAQENGNFGGHINGWHKLGQSQGVVHALFTMQVDEQLGKTNPIVPWAIGGGLLSLLGMAALWKYRSKKNKTHEPEEDDSMTESLQQEGTIN